MTGDEAPTLSIVVVALRGGDATLRLLDALTQASDPAEILVTGGCEDEPRPGIEWLTTPATASVPERRGLGAARASGEVVAFLEDTVLPEPGWGKAVRALHAAHPDAQAIGGTVRLASSGLTPAALALALLDAGRFIRTGVTSEAAIALAGCNLSFKRAALEKLGALSGAPLREAEAIPALADRPGAVRLESDMAVTLVAADPTGQRLASRFHHGRLYAGHSGRGLAERGLRVLLVPLLPAVLVFRCWRIAVRIGLQQRVPVLTRALFLASAWSLGEAAGFLCGPGDAERHWR